MPGRSAELSILGWALLVLISSSVIGGTADEKKYAGISIKIGVQNVQAIGSPAKAHAATWELRTGGTAQVVSSDFGELFADYMASLKSAEPFYDVLLSRNHLGISVK